MLLALDASLATYDCSIDIISFFSIFLGGHRLFIVITALAISGELWRQLWYILVAAHPHVDAPVAVKRLAEQISSTWGEPIRTTSDNQLTEAL